MNTILRAGFLVVAVSASASASQAQTPTNIQPAAPEFANSDRGESVAEIVAKADESLGNNDFDRARRLYRRAASVQRAQGGAPIDALRRIANAYYLEGRPVDAAGVLKDLANVAAEHGDIVAQANAYADAAMLYGSVGSLNDYRAAVDRLKKVLQSTYMPSADRARIETRLKSSVGF